MRKLLITTALSLGFAAPAAAQLNETFHCGAGDMTYSVTVSILQINTANVRVTVGEMMDQSLARQFPLSQVAAASGYAYEGEDVRQGKVRFAATGPEDGQMTFADGSALSCDYDYDVIGVDAPEKSLANKAMDEMEESRLRNQRTPVYSSGISMGNRLRSGPGKDFNSTGKIKKGTKLYFENATGIVEDGYRWFEVRAGDHTGYMWGGSLCYTFKEVEGMFGHCGEQGLGGTNRLDWMAYSINHQGAIGHSMSYDRDNARAFSKSKCGFDCEIVDDAQAPCHAFADYRTGGYWYGIAYGDDPYETRRQARKFCEDGAPGKCKIRHDVCQEVD